MEPAGHQMQMGKYGRRSRGFDGDLPVRRGCLLIDGLMAVLWRAERRWEMVLTGWIWDWVRDAERVHLLMSRKSLAVVLTTRRRWHHESLSVSVPASRRLLWW